MRPYDTDSVTIRIKSIVALSVLLCLCVSCDKDWFGKQNKDFDKKPSQTMYDISLYKSDRGRVQAFLTSSVVETFGGDSARTVFPKGLRVLFYNEDLSDKAVLTANYAIDMQGSGLVRLQDSVRIVNYNSKDTIYCRDLYWNKKAGIIYSQKPIRRYTANGRDYGDGLTANEMFDSVTIINPRGRQLVDEQ